MERAQAKPARVPAAPLELAAPRLALGLVARLPARGRAETHRVQGRAARPQALERRDQEPVGPPEAGPPVPARLPAVVGRAAAAAKFVESSLINQRRAGPSHRLADLFPSRAPTRNTVSPTAIGARPS